MIQLNKELHHQRAGADCYNCDNLPLCPLRENILSKTEVWCNYAAEGCEKYAGSVKRNEEKHMIVNLTSHEMGNYIREKAIREGRLVKSECLELGIDAEALYDQIQSLKKRGLKLS